MARHFAEATYLNTYQAYPISMEIYKGGYLRPVSTKQWMVGGRKIVARRVILDWICEKWEVNEICAGEVLLNLHTWEVEDNNPLSEEEAVEGERGNTIPELGAKVDCQKSKGGQRLDGVFYSWAELYAAKRKGCIRCQTMKLLVEFSASHNRTSQGFKGSSRYKGECKVCTSLYNRRRRPLSLL